MCRCCWDRGVIPRIEGVERSTGAEVYAERDDCDA